MPDPNVQFIERAGCRIAWSVRGDGVPVLFIQGVGVWGDGWKPQTDSLSDRYRCVTFDNRGMARSQPMGDRISIEMMTDDAIAVMDAAGLDSAHIVGHSMGGLIALQLALATPERVRSLSLICTFASGAVPTRLTPGMFWLGMRTRVGTRRMRRNAFLQFVMPPDLVSAADRNVLAAQLAPIFGYDLADHPPVVMKQLGAMKSYDATARLHEITAPTVIVSAAHDRIALPSAGKALASGIPNARYVEIADAAHGLPVQLADRTNAILREHIDQAEATSVARIS